MLVLSMFAGFHMVRNATTQQFLANIYHENEFAGNVPSVWNINAYNNIQLFVFLYDPNPNPIAQSLAQSLTQSLAQSRIQSLT